MISRSTVNRAYLLSDTVHRRAQMRTELDRDDGGIY